MDREVFMIRFMALALAFAFSVQAQLNGDPNDPDSATLSASTPAAPAGSVDLLSQYDGQEPGALDALKAQWRGLLGKLGLTGSSTRQGNAAYQAGDYDLALQRYAEGLLDAPESQMLQYNAGNAHYRKRKYDDAIANYRKAILGDNAALAAKAWYNLGNAYFRKGEFALQQGKQEGISDYREALAAYKKSLEIRPENKDAKRNIEVVQARIKELLEQQKQDQNQQQQQGPQKPPPEPSEEAKRILARALQLTAERRYAEAKALLEDLLIKDATAESYKSHVQRLDDVLKILRGETPNAPGQQDPRAQQPGMGVI
jgi:tetratricopeptide (TPR) repeat protein